MESTLPDRRRSQTRTYDRSSSVVFRKTREAFGGLSNMAGGFPLLVNGVRIRTSEALYQACRFPHLPDVQRLIIAQRSPMTAKMKGKTVPTEVHGETGNRVRVTVMRWCLRVKLAQNWEFFSKLLLDTGDRAIVEQSRRDDFWGAKPVDDRTLVGMNVLGRLLMELREFVKAEPEKNLRRVEPLLIPNFLLGGRPIEPVMDRILERAEPVVGTPAHPSRYEVPEPTVVELPLAAPKLTARPLREDPAKYAVRGGNIKSYPVYKDSGVPWLEKVPEHWEVRTLAQLGRLSKGRGGNKEDEVPAGVPCVRYGDLYTTHDYFVRASRTFVSTEKASEYTPIKFGDVLFAGSGETIDEIGKSAVNLMRADACCGGDVIVFRPKRHIDARYMGYATGCHPAAAQKATMGRGITVMHIYGTRLKSLSLPFPPLPEQAAVVRFLDHADRRIRRYIRAKQKLIALLEEQKQAIIHQAVTGQIDVRTGRPYPAYKTSGVEWLGRVPEDWEVLRLGRLIALTVGFPFKSDGFTQSDGDMRLLRGVNVAPGRVRWEDVVRWPASDVARFAEYRLQVGDITLGMDRPVIGGGIRVAAVAQSDVPSLLLQRVARIRPKQRLLGEFALGLLGGRRFSDYLVPIFTGVSVPHLSPEQIGAFPLALPSIAEQVRIVEYLRSGVDVLHASVERAHEEIALLGEYRTRLIADVVTGRLDVGEAAAGLPEVDPLAADDDSDDGAKPKAWSDGNQFGVIGQDAEA